MPGITAWQFCMPVHGGRMISIDLRMRQLEDNIHLDLILLKEYENILRVESDPRRLARYNIEIKRQKEALDRYNTEYKELQKQTKGLMPEKSIEIDRQLHEMNAILMSIQCDVINMRKNLDASRKDLLDKFDEIEQNIVYSVVNKLDESLLLEVNRVLNAFESLNISENIFMDMSNLLKELLEEIKDSELNYNIQLANQTNHLLSEINKPELTLEQKLKISVPIIPFILSYEGIAGMSEAIELKSLWNRLKDMVCQNK